MNKVEINGWKLDYSHDSEYGLTLSNVSHNDYNFAKIMRLISIVVEIEIVDKDKNEHIIQIPIKLNSDKFGVEEDINAIEEKVNYYNSNKIIVPDAQQGYIYSVYSPLYICPITQYTSKNNKIFIPNFGAFPEEEIIIQLTYSASSYSKNPPHDNFGALTAARIFPVLNFILDDERPTSIDFVFKFKNISFTWDFDFNVATFLNPDEEKELQNELKNNPIKKTNMAGVFRDAESLPQFLLEGYELMVLLSELKEKKWQEDEIGKLLYEILLQGDKVYTTLNEFISSIPFEYGEIRNKIIKLLDDLDKVLKRVREIKYYMYWFKAIPVVRLIADLIEFYTDFLIFNGYMMTWAGFQACEKPLLNEIVSHGLVRGQPFYKNKPSTYDNLHWWGNFKRSEEKDYVKKQPSAPGAFFAVHFHWRWGNLISNNYEPAGNPTKDEQSGYKILNFLDEFTGSKKGKHYSGNIQFRSLVEQFKDGNKSYGGPLLDPRIEDQDIQFAVLTSYSKSFFLPELSKPNHDINFMSLVKYAKEFSEGKKFKNIDNILGNDISKGTDISFLYYTKIYLDEKEKSYYIPNIIRYKNSKNTNSDSLQANLNDNLENENNSFEVSKLYAGSLLIQGIYFAHDIEPGFSLLPGVDSNIFGFTENVDIHKPPRSKTDAEKIFRVG